LEREDELGKDAVGLQEGSHLFDGSLYDNEQALVSLKIKETVDAEGWRTKAVVIEGG